MSHTDVAVLHAYLDGACEPQERRDVEAHLESCAECRDTLERAARERDTATELLGRLEPGPIHAPAFADLQARAAAASTVVPRATPTPAVTASSRRPWWRRPAMAWAASLVIAFGMGWLTRTELGGPAMEQAALEASDAASRQLMREPEETDAKAAALPSEEAQEAEEAIAPATVGFADEVAAAAPTPAAADDLAEAPPAVVAPSRAQVGADVLPAQAEPPATPDTDLARRRGAAALGEAAAANADRREEARAVGQAAASEYRRVAPLRPLEDDAAVGGVDYFAMAGGYIALPLEDANRWLGVAPRQLLELSLLRAEVGPGSLMPDGVAGRPAVRLVYRAASGQEVVLVQQYLGTLPVGSEAESSADEPVGRASALRTERANRASSELRAGERFDRDGAATAAVDLPVRSIDPSGLVTYRWIDADGYFLSLSGTIDPDVIQGLAERIR